MVRRGAEGAGQLSFYISDTDYSSTDNRSDVTSSTILGTIVAQESPAAGTTYNETLTIKPTVSGQYVYMTSTKMEGISEIRVYADFLYENSIEKNPSVDEPSIPENPENAENIENASPVEPNSLEE